MTTSAQAGMTVQLDGPPAPADAASRPAVRNPLRWMVFAVVIAANIMDLMDATIVNVAGPRSERGWAVLPLLCSGWPPATRSHSRSS